MKIKTGDNVKIMSGKDKGKTGKVIQVFSDIQKVVVDGVNKTKRHLRSRRSGESGQVVEYSAPISASNVSLLCGKCGQTTRVSVKSVVEPSGKEKKLRVCKKCKETI